MNRVKQMVVVIVPLAVALVLAVTWTLLPTTRAGKEVGAQQAPGEEIARAADLGKSSATENEPDTHRARAAEIARYTGLAEYYAREKERTSTQLAANPELMIAQRYAAAANLPQADQNSITRFGLAEFVAAQKDATMLKSDSAFLAANPELKALIAIPSK